MSRAHRGAIGDIDAFRREANPPQERFKRTIACGYQQPEKALENITRRAGEVGLRKAAQEIWNNPSQFGRVANRDMVGKAGQALGVYHRKTAAYPNWLKCKTGEQLTRIRAAHVKQLSGWNHIKNAARSQARGSIGGRAAERSVSSVIGASRAARELAKNPEKTPFKVSHKLLTQARSQMETDGGQATSSLLEGSAKNGLTAATLVTSPTQGGVRLMQHIISGASSIGHEAERSR